MPLTQIARKRIIIYTLLLLFLWVAYLPLSSFLFALKNDALTTNFPNKYFFSTALHSGFLPVWNPYVNFGLPLHADPGFAFWNPITWIFGWIGYSVPMLSVEILFYIWIAGITAYELGIFLKHSRRVSFCMGIMFMCSGFFIGNLQHINFLTCAAFLPLVIKTWLELQHTFNFRKLFLCLASLYMMAAGGHPAIPVACMYFLLFIQLGLLLFNDTVENNRNLLFRLIRTDIILSAGFLLLAAPLIYSYFEIYPRFTRSAGVIQSSFSDSGFDLPSYLSFLFPFSTTAKTALFSNDPLMRNGYFSLAGLVCLLMVLRNKKNRLQKIFLFAGACMLILSLGGPVKESVYSALPLLDHIRTNGEFRVFGILSFIMAGSFMLAELMEGRHLKSFNRLLLFLAAVSLLLVAGYLIFSAHGIWRYSYGGDQGVAGKIKSLLDEMTFSDRMFINASVMLFLIGLYFLLKDKLGLKWLMPVFIMVDLLIFCWIQLPVTGVQLLSPSSIQQFFNGIPSGIPVPRLEPILNNQAPDRKMKAVIGCWSYYNKQPGTPEQCGYPTVLNNTAVYFNGDLPDSLSRKPFIFTKNTGLQKNITIQSFAPDNIEFSVKTDMQDTVILLQNDYLRWNARVNDKPVKIQPAAIAFMGIALEKGLNKVQFIYNYKDVVWITVLNVFIWIFLIAFVLLKRPDRPLA